jgi:hypothetical protein
VNTTDDFCPAVKGFSAEIPPVDKTLDENGVSHKADGARKEPEKVPGTD